jgi:hypothetical protein
MSVMHTVLFMAVRREIAMATEAFMNKAAPQADTL